MGFAVLMKSLFSRHGKTLSLYRSGMEKANKRDYNGAIVDYSAAIRTPHIAADVKAMALYNRSLAYSAIHEEEKSAADLQSVLEIPGLPKKIKIEAQERRERTRRRDARATDRAAQRKRE